MYVYMEVFIEDHHISSGYYLQLLSSLYVGLYCLALFKRFLFVVLLQHYNMESGRLYLSIKRYNCIMVFLYAMGKVENMK